MKRKIDIARSSAERDLTISTTKQIEVLYNGQERECSNAMFVSVARAERFPTTNHGRKCASPKPTSD